jgi:hypothetical protein
MFIPLLENEIVDSNRTGVFLEELEKIFQEEAYLVHIEEKARLQREKSKEQYGMDASKPLERDFETMRRRNEILTKIKNRQKT